ncbi:Helix-turn-helix domain protein [Corynebacterium atrinae]|nr:Helix-turn-helix domain protein [Corynebacterium atrinae]
MIRISKKGPVVSELWLSADDIATHLGVSKDTVYTWIADRSMPAHKIGRLWKFQASEVDDWVRRGGASASGGSE